MIGRLVDLALRNRGLVLVLAVVLVVVGMRAFQLLPIEAYPDVADTWVQIITQWPGHAPEEIERQITIPTERTMNGVPHKAILRSVSISGLSVVTLLFEEGTDPYLARQQVTERLEEIHRPEGSTRSLGPLSSPTGEILRYRLVNCSEAKVPECSPDDVRRPPLSLNDLKDLEEYVVERDLLGVHQVADVVSFGGTTKRYEVLVDPLELVEHSLTFDDVTKALAAANANAGGGIVPFGRAALNVRGIGLLTPDEIGDVLLATRDGVPVRVRQVATVQVGHQPRLGRVSVDEQKDVVAATVLLRTGEQADTALRALHLRIDALNTRILPRGVKVAPYHDRTELMHLTTHTVLENLGLGVLLITVVLFFFIGNVRAALIAAVTIPLALLFAFVCLDAAHIPANLLSIGALDFGMIVDGSIVMVENVFRHVAERRTRGEHHDLFHIVEAASREVARPVVFAMTMIVVAYLPIFTLQRVEGKLFRPMAWTVAFALVGALVVSITVVPVLATYAFRRTVRESPNRVLAWIWRNYEPLLGKLLARPRRAIAIAIVIAVADFLMFKAMGSEFLPHLDEGAVWMRATLPSNVSLGEAETLVDGEHDARRDVRGMRDVLARYPEIRTVAVHLGRPDDGTDPTGFYNAEVLMVLEPRARWRKDFHESGDALIASISRDMGEMPGVSFSFSQPIADNVEEALTGVKGQIAVKISGDDLNALDDLATRIARTIAPVRGIVDLSINRELGQSNVTVEISRDRAERFGMTVDDVQDVVENGVGGQVATAIYEAERAHDLVVRYAEVQRSDLGALRALLVPRPEGKIVPLAHVADVNVVGGASRVYREGNRRYIAVRFGIRGRDLGSTIDEAQANVASLVKVPAGYEVEWGGEFESARRASHRLAIVIPVTLIVLFGLLFLAFGRLRDAVVVLANVLLTAPLGGLVALLATRTNFSVSAGVGFLALFGASVQTGIVVLSDVETRRAQGASADAALRYALHARLRPIVMMALVATLGLVPAAVSTGIGSDSQKPLAIVVVGGLFSSLALSLVMLPMLYKLIAARRG